MDRGEEYLNWLLSIATKNGNLDDFDVIKDNMGKVIVLKANTLDPDYSGAFNIRDIADCICNREVKIIDVQN